MAEKPTVLMTGVSGKLGLRVLKQLEDFHVVGVDVHPPEDARALTHFEQTDLAQERSCDQLLQLLRAYRPEAVIHLAFVVDPTRARVMDRSRMWHINVAGSGRDLLADVLTKLESLGFSCRFVDDETTLMWNKLVFLGPFALATSAFGAPIGEVLANGTWHQKLETCIREFCSVALAEGAQVNPDKVVAAFSMVPKDMRSSMQKDVDRGNLPELEAIAGPVLRGGARHGISVAATGELAAAVEHRTQVSSQHR